MPNGLSDARKTYLFKEIRYFCKEEAKDLVCPNPDNDIHLDPESEVDSEVDEVIRQPPRKKRTK
jgi:hypothetical protein